MGSASRHRWRYFGGCWLLAGFFAAAGMAFAAPAGSAHLEPFPALLSMPSLEAITPGWRGARTASLQGNAVFRTRLAGIDLALASTRFRVDRQGATHGASAGFPYLGGLQRLAVSVPVGQGLRLHTNLQYTRLRRSFAMTTATGLPRSTRSVAAGLGVASDAGPALNLSYVRIGRLGRTTAMDRAVQLLAGAPPAGQGFRLAVADRGGAMVPGELRWSLSMAAIRRAPVTLTDTAPDTVLDHRAELRLGLAF